MKVAIIQYSTYGHITTFSQSIAEGVKKSGLASTVDIFQVPETLSEDVLKLIHAPGPSKEIPLATTQTLEEYDAFLFGLPTRFGTLPAQWSTFWDTTGSLWASGALYHKPVGLYVSTGSPQGGQEETVRNFFSYVAHHGLVYIPLGYGPAFPLLTSFDEIHGGSPYGAGTYAGTDGSKQPSELEKKIAVIQGEEFSKSASKIVAATGTSSSSSTTGTATPAAAAAAATAAPAATSTEETTAVGSTTEKEAVAEKKAPATKRAAQSTPAPKEEKTSTCAKCVIV
ncbi:hypothetical protein CAAN1_01S14202 [[Candida] anglica]|uniref:Flavodoxin-like domain-containing protein n=1 Tax=[Candida] anglica TaxID=148631 RepID=A0ABP0EPN7_9ASCO